MSQNLVVTILGRKGSGKSTLARELIDERDRVVILDSIGEYPDDKGFPRGVEEIWGFDDCLSALEQAEERDKFRLSLRCYQKEEDLDLLDCCFELRDCLVVVEETWRFCTPYEVPDPLAKLVRFGRHRGLDQIYISQRAASIHRDLTAQSDLIVSFRQHEGRDVLYLKSLGDENESVRTLPDFKVVCIGDLDRAPAPILARVHVVPQRQLALEFDGTDNDEPEAQESEEVDDADNAGVDSG